MPQKHKPTHTLPAAEKMPYWGTGRSAPDIWMERTKAVLRKLGATDVCEYYGDQGGRSCYCLTFKIGDENYRVVWPVLPSKLGGSPGAARIQAATMLYHDCKARALAAAVRGARAAFFSDLVLPGGSTAAEVAIGDAANYYRLEGPK